MRHIFYLHDNWLFKPVCILLPVQAEKLALIGAKIVEIVE